MNNVIAAIIAVFAFFAIQAFVAANDNFDDLELGCPVENCN